MNNSYDLVILNGTCAKHDGITKIDIGIKNGVIVALENLKQVNSKKVLNIQFFLKFQKCKGHH